MKVKRVQAIRIFILRVAELSAAGKDQFLFQASHLTMCDLTLERPVTAEIGPPRTRIEKRSSRHLSL
jgi:hypothetical protein